MTQGSLLDWTPAKASAAARDALTPKRLRDDHRAILRALADGPLPDTDILARTGIHPNAVRARRGELVEMGLVFASPTPLLRNGRKVTAWSCG